MSARPLQRNARPWNLRSWQHLPKVAWPARCTPVGRAAPASLLLGGPIEEHAVRTTCNLQGLSPTQRSTQTAPSRDLTLGGKEQKRKPCTSPHRCGEPRGRHPPSKGKHSGVSTRHGCCKSLHRHERACITNTNRHVSSCWSRHQSLYKHMHACITNTSTHAT